MNSHEETIRRIKAELGERLIILGHHYQSDEVIACADYVGDSLELARKASQIDKAQYIVFCGVHFMAESAYILAPGKSVYIPDRSAGCPLADMAALDDVLAAWDIIREISRSVVPVSYVNSSASLKAFCGREDGIICTSGNALKVLGWAFERGEKVLFMPDMNLGRNTARSMGIPEDEMALWDPSKPGGGLDAGAIERARIILWKGWCPVHWPSFTADDVQSVRERFPGVKVIVHPESDPGTVAASDASGSTASILDHVKGLKPGDTLAIGTEVNMVRRAARSRDDVRIMPLREVSCDDMARITLEKLARTLTHLDGDACRVVVPEDVARDARKALMNMLRI
ncbi:MAG TPA: quinolinate synthase NadA [Deltaproteobacteria bacterium]|jgi:quinolinate synthase|nr:quinolinate synthase NadA [Deltaproteobacteria bacterium]HOI07901.1 quinolinate synthase NadA [Deltaproteobacteria bacterium]